MSIVPAPSDFAQRPGQFVLDTSIHIGATGDAVPPALLLRELLWAGTGLAAPVTDAGDPEAAARAGELGLGSVDELQSWFLRSLAGHLGRYGRRAASIRTCSGWRRSAYRTGRPVVRIHGSAAAAALAGVTRLRHER